VAFILGGELNAVLIERRTDPKRLKERSERARERVESDGVVDDEGT
jgi:hypothetical protein